MFSGPLERPPRSALCFRREGHGQDGAASAGLSAHQGEPGFAGAAGCSAPRRPARERLRGARDLRPGLRSAGQPTLSHPAPRPDPEAAIFPRPPHRPQTPRVRAPPSPHASPAPGTPRGLRKPPDPGSAPPVLTALSPQLGRYSALFLGVVYGAKRYGE